MHDVSNAINILDPSNAIDKKICKTGDTSSDSVTKCATNNSDHVGLSKLTSGSNSNSKFNSWDKKLSEVPYTAETISKETSALTREQKGVVSSAFRGADSSNYEGGARYTSKMYILKKE